MTSQFSPYQVPMYPPRGDWLAPGATLLAPARRAGALMLTLGALALLGALLMTSAAFMPLDELLRRSNLDLSQLQTGEMTPQQYVRTMFIVTAVFCLSVSILLLIMGALVRGGGMASAVVAIILVGLLTLLMGVMELVQFIQAAMQPNDYAIGSVIFFGLILAALGLLIAWLAVAIKSAGELQRARRLQAEQWYAMQHHPAWNSFATNFTAASNGGTGEPTTSQPA